MSRRRWPVEGWVLRSVPAVGVGASVLLLVIGGALVRARHEAVVDARAERLRDALRGRFERVEVEVTALAAFFAVHPDPSPTTFARFASRVRRQHPGWRAVAFIPEVTPDDRERLRAWWTSMAGARRAERYPQVLLPPLDARDLVLPVVMAEPEAARPGVVGFDFASSEARRAAAEKALETRGLTLTGSVELSQDRGTERTSVLLVAPVFSAAASSGPFDRALVAASFTPSVFLDEVIAEVGGAFELELGFDDDRASLGVARGRAPSSLATFSLARRLDLGRLGDAQLLLAYTETRSLGFGDALGLFGLPVLTLVATFFAAADLGRTERSQQALESALAKREAQLRVAMAASARASKLESLGRLVGGVAHDFNNLLTVIQGNAESLEEVDSPIERAECTAAIRAASRRGASLTRKLLAFGRKMPLRPEPLEVRVLFEELRRVLERVLPETIEVEIALPSEALVLFADRGQLESVLLSLALNARDAMPSGGRLVLGARPVGASALSSETTDPSGTGAFVALTVTDTGTGMPPEVVEQAFEPFFTTKPESAGSGLGLASAYGFARQSGGEAHLSSELGLGTEVELIFPAAEGPPRSLRDTPTPRPPSWPSARRLTRRALVVEDQPAVRRVIGDFLRREGLEVVEAGSGTEALAELEGFVPDVVVTDAVMPGRVQGPELIAAVARRRPTTALVILTGYADPDLGLDGHVLPNGTVVLQKPISRSRLLEGLSRAVVARRAAAGPEART